MCFFLSHSFVALAVCFGSRWNTHPRPIFNALALTVHVPVHRPFDAVQLFCPLSRKTPPKHNVSTSVFDSGGGVLGVIGSIPPRPHLTTTVSPTSPLNLWKTSDGLTVHVLSWARGPCGRSRISVIHGVVCYQLFSWWLWSYLPWDHWQYWQLLTFIRDTWEAEVLLIDGGSNIIKMQINL